MHIKLTLSKTETDLLAGGWRWESLPYRHNGVLRDGMSFSRALKNILLQQLPFLAQLVQAYQTESPQNLKLVMDDIHEYVMLVAKQSAQPGQQVYVDQGMTREYVVQLVMNSLGKKLRAEVSVPPLAQLESQMIEQALSMYSHTLNHRPDQNIQVLNLQQLSDAVASMAIRRPGGSLREQFPALDKRVQEYLATYHANTGSGDPEKAKALAEAFRRADGNRRDVNIDPALSDQAIAVAISREFVQPRVR